MACLVLDFLNICLHPSTCQSKYSDCQLVTEVGRRHLRSWDVYTCAVPRTQSVTDQGQKLHGSWNPRGSGTICRSINQSIRDY